MLDKEIYHRSEIQADPEPEQIVWSWGAGQLPSGSMTSDRVGCTRPDVDHVLGHWTAYGRYADETDPEAQLKALEAEAIERDGQDTAFGSGLGH